MIVMKLLLVVAVVVPLAACGATAKPTATVTVTAPAPESKAPIPVPPVAEAAPAAPQSTGNTIEEGTWTVGVDVKPGTYRVAAAVTGPCYWEITKSGTNTSDIIENDVVTGGRPTVTLAAGQDFTTEQCGTWVKQ